MCAQVTAWRAGHVLGAAMFMVEIAGMRLLYTGDYSRLADRHMPAADLPSPPPHIGARPRTVLGRSLLTRAALQGLGASQASAVAWGEGQVVRREQI
jgi:hypothetical protein